MSYNEHNINRLMIIQHLDPCFFKTNNITRVQITYVIYMYNSAESPWVLHQYLAGKTLCNCLDKLFKIAFQNLQSYLQIPL